MSFSIQANYSILNNYSYENKSLIMSTLDLLSYPLRNLLNGRNVYVLEQTYSNTTSTAGKVMIVFALALTGIVSALAITPYICPFLLIVPVVCLAAKFVFSYIVSEESQIINESNKAWEVINNFNEAFNNNNYSKAIQVYSQNPDIGQRDDVYDNLFKCVNRLVNDNYAWADLQRQIQLLRTNDAITLIDHAIHLKLDHEKANNYVKTEGIHIRNFVKNSLRDSSQENIQSCYKRIFENSLHINPDQDDLYIQAYKMDLADDMIKSFKAMALRNAKDDLERSIAKLSEDVMRPQIFTSDKSVLNQSFMFRMYPEKMQLISAAVQDIRNLSGLTEQYLGEINTLISQGGDWDLARPTYIEFQNSINTIFPSPSDLEKDFIQALQDILTTMIEFGNTVQSSNSPEELERLAQKMTDNYEKHCQNTLNFIKPPEVSFDFNENFIALLVQKKRADLWILTEKMKSFLLVDIFKTALTRLQHELV